jgi:hypothetical protein
MVQTQYAELARKHEPMDWARTDLREFVRSSTMLRSSARRSCWSSIDNDTTSLTQSTCDQGLMSIGARHMISGGFGFRDNLGSRHMASLKSVVCPKSHPSTSSEESHVKPSALPDVC